MPAVPKCVSEPRRNEVARLTALGLGPGPIAERIGITYSGVCRIREKTKEQVKQLQAEMREETIKLSAKRASVKRIVGIRDI